MTTYTAEDVSGTLTSFDNIGEFEAFIKGTQSNQVNDNIRRLYADGYCYFYNSNCK